tara:strand:+ start:838 stop:1050 length:213 start_codon:yes stop_codon:yes gene_type:complete
MISAITGAVIMSAVTVAMLIAVKVTDDALSKVGNYPLTNLELEILENAGYLRDDQLKEFREYIEKFEYVE